MHLKSSLAADARPSRQDDWVLRRTLRVAEWDDLNIELLKDQQMKRCHNCLSQCRAPLSPNQMREKLWTCVDAP